MENKDFYEVRNDYIDLIKKELLGPGKLRYLVNTKFLQV